MTSKRIEEWFFFEKCSNRLQLDLSSLLVNLLDVLGQILAIYDFLEAIRVILAMFEPTPTWPNFYFGQLFIWIEANNDQICLPRGEISDLEQCSNRLQLDLILLLDNFWYELGKIMTRYVFLEQLTYFYFWSTYDFRQAMTRYDC